jgi:glycosyltransferase involved in cell wall biosynthesis
MTPAAAELHAVDSVLAPGCDCPLDLTIFVSCYNEAPYIIRTLDTLRAAMAELAFSYEIIVIDDCSRDGSADLVEDYVRSNPKERLLVRRNTSNIGWAQNYIDAEPKETIVKVFQEIGTADIIIPYYLTNEGRSWQRGFLSSAYVALVNLISGFHLKYYNGLPVHLRYNVMRWHSNTRGFGFQADILCLLLEQGFTFKEVPVVAVEQKGGKSTALSLKNMTSVGHTLLDIAIRRIANMVYRRG